jgi:hypothetical protein
VFGAWRERGYAVAFEEAQAAVGAPVGPPR